MASSSHVEVEGFGVFDDIEALLDAIDKGDIIEDPLFDGDVNKALLDMNKENSGTKIKCSFCIKICKSKSGMKRHVRSNHPEEFLQEELQNEQKNCSMKRAGNS